MSGTATARLRGPGQPGTDELLGAVAEAAAATGTETYLVGGFVRDRLLGRPGKDIDLVCVGSDGTAVLESVAARFGWSRPQRFERFGTGQVRGGEWVLEVVRARAERYDPGSRRPEVRPGTLDEDIWRRDFTVNALCQTLDGVVIDRTGRGLDDLRGGILRTPLDPRETFGEDPLRMFRGARFVAQLGMRLADGLLEAMRAEAPRTAILSPERVRDELSRLLVQPGARAGLEVLRAGGLLEVVMPEALEMVGVAQSGYHVYDVWDHTTHTVEAAPPDLLTRLACLFHDIGKPRTHVVAPDGRHTFHNHPEVGARVAEEVLGRLRYSNDQIRDVGRLVRLHLRPIQYQDATHSDSAVRRLVRDSAGLRTELLDLARADTAASSYPDTENIESLERRMAALDQDETVSRLRSPLDGAALMELAGRAPGPWVGTVMRALMEAVLEGELPADDAAAAAAWLGQHPELLAAPGS
ncbi:MAG: CCA tRNA nucleotidyltransferase [Candidatus Dormibacteria bacterium]